MKKENLIQCKCCGCLINEDDVYLGCDGEQYCVDCFGELFQVCEICGDLSWREDCTYIESSDEIVCLDCLNDNFTECSHCGKLIRNSDVFYDDLDNTYCEYCYYEYAVFCENCGRVVPVDDYDFEADMCLDCCSEQKNNKIKDYHSHNYKPIGTGNKFKGIELEIENNKFICANNDLANILHDLTNKDNEHIYFERDGSLNNGFEIITQPHTITDFYNIPWEKLLKSCVENGFISHNANSCGLHIHYSREFFGDNKEVQDENIGKLIAFYENNIDNLLRFSRRTFEQYTRWANHYNTCGDIEKCKDIPKQYNDRYHYINLTNTNTIEFRLGRGTLNFDSFKAWNNFHDVLVLNCLDVSYDDINNYKTWFNGLSQDTINYLKNKNCFTDVLEILNA